MSTAIQFYAVLVIAFIGYMTPTVAALMYRRDKWKRIALFNLVLGWTIIGWFFAFLAAFGGERDAARHPES